MNVLKEEKLDRKSAFSVLVAAMVFSGIFGFIYEILFYRIDLGYFVKRGSTFGPWIPIYAWGALFVLLLTYRFRKKPILVFILNVLITGITEFLSAFAIEKIFHKRLWDYNVEIWNFGNINGYICLRSVLFFSISSLFLIYVVVPMIIKLTKKYKNFSTISLCLGLLFLVDELVYFFIH